MLESITAVLKPATESLQGKQVDLGSCMTTITLMKQQLQEMNGDYYPLPNKRGGGGGTLADFWLFSHLKTLIRQPPRLRIFLENFQ